MQLPPPALEQRDVGGILHQRVLERVARVRRRSAPRDEPGRGEPLKRRVEVHRGQGRHGGNQLVGELPSDGGADQRHVLARPSRSRRASSEACSVVGMASGGSGPSSTWVSVVSRNSPLSSSVLVSSSMNSGTPSVCARTCSTMASGSALSLVTPAMMPALSRRPRRLKGSIVTCGWPTQVGWNSGRKRHHQQHRQIGDASNDSIEKIERCRIDPVDVLEHDQDGALRRDAVELVEKRRSVISRFCCGPTANAG